MKKNIRRIVLIAVIAAALLIFFIYAIVHYVYNKPITYNKALDLVAVTVEDKDLTLYDLAFYIGFEEQKINEQALIYDPEHPLAYWNIHTNGEWLRDFARESAVDMMIHDYVYSTEGASYGIALTAEEQAACDADAQDFWNDLGESGQEALGIPEEQVYIVCTQIGISEKYMNLLAEEEGRDRAVYEVGGVAWEEKKDTLDIKYNKHVLDRIQIGEITINQKIQTED